MTFWQVIVSGVVQGITEFLPISSAGHLVILHHFFGIKTPQVALDVLLHVGTLLAVVVFFSRDIKEIFVNNKRFGLLVLIGSIPTFLIGFLCAQVFEAMFTNIKIVGACLGTTGVWLFIGNWAIRRRDAVPAPGNGKLKLWQALIVGTAQGLALMPGISRSGATISTGALCGLNKDLAFRYSFLLLIPATLGAFLYKIVDTEIVFSFSWASLAGMTIAFLIGMFSLKVLYTAVKRSRLYIFGMYCMALSLFLITR